MTVTKKNHSMKAPFLPYVPGAMSPSSFFSINYITENSADKTRNDTRSGDINGSHTSK